MKDTDSQELVIYQAPNGAIELRTDVDMENIWATQSDLSVIFEKDQSVISRHIKNIFQDNEVSEKSNMQKMHIANSDKPVMQYSLDVILAVGYRTNSARAIDFRKWATQTLKQHITQGYTINHRLLSQKKDLYLKALDDIKILNAQGDLLATDDVLDIIKSFSETWFSLQSYDEGTIPNKGFTQKDLVLSSDELYTDIQTFKSELIAKGEATEIFAQEKTTGSLKGIFGNVMQSAFGNDVYPTLEEKASHFLYFIIKNHPFNDGNKRTGAFTFLWFLKKSGLDTTITITPNTLTALTLLIAQSDPTDKNRVIGLILLMFR